MGATSVFRKVFSIFMAVVMVLTLQVWVPQNAFAEEPDTNGEGPQLLTFGDPDDSAETEGEVLAEEVVVEEETITPVVPVDEPEALLEDYITVLTAEVAESYDTVSAEAMNSVIVSNQRGSRLTGAEKNAYDLLRSFIEEIAAGSDGVETTEITLSFRQLFPESVLNTRYTADDLGVEAIAVQDPTSGEYSITKEAKTATAQQYNLNLAQVINALLFDCPYELFWYEKTAGVDCGRGSVVGASWNNGEWLAYCDPDESDFTFTFAVSNDYAPSSFYVHEFNGVNKPIQTNRERIQDIQTAVTNAAGIVADAASAQESDYDKLTYYKDQICEAVVYNEFASKKENDVPYGDPWQLVSVFDKDPSTNVVCEGYSKAFKYLCDLTTFDDGSLDCYTVTGEMGGGTGAGGHMWNLAVVGGENYLVDVTNCDEGTIGDRSPEPDALFLVGNDNPQAATVEGLDSITYTFTPNNSQVTYTYDEDTVQAFRLAELTLATSDYSVPEAYFSDSFHVNEDATNWALYYVEGASGTVAPEISVRRNGADLPSTAYTISYEHSLGFDANDQEIFEPAQPPFGPGTYRAWVQGTGEQGFDGTLGPLWIDVENPYDLSSPFADIYFAQGASYQHNINPMNSDYYVIPLNQLASVLGSLEVRVGGENSQENPHDGTLLDSSSYDVTYYPADVDAAYGEGGASSIAGAALEGIPTARGAYVAVILGKSPYSGTHEVLIDVQGSMGDAEIARIDDQMYAGSPIEPEISVSLGGQKLTEGADYTVSFSGNNGPGTATVTIADAYPIKENKTGQPEFLNDGRFLAGTKSATFAIGLQAPTNLQWLEEDGWQWATWNGVDGAEKYYVELRKDGATYESPCLEVGSQPDVAGTQRRQDLTSLINSGGTGDYTFVVFAQVGEYPNNTDSASVESAQKHFTTYQVVVENGAASDTQGRPLQSGTAVPGTPILAQYDVPRYEEYMAFDHFEILSGLDETEFDQTTRSFIMPANDVSMRSIYCITKMDLGNIWGATARTPLVPTQSIPFTTQFDPDGVLNNLVEFADQWWKDTSTGAEIHVGSKTTPIVGHTYQFYVKLKLKGDYGFTAGKFKPFIVGGSEVPAARQQKTLNTDGTATLTWGLTATCKVVDITGATVTNIVARTYNGKAQTQAPAVKLDGKTLMSGTDYTLSYKNNKNAGTATVTITGKGSYTGSISKTFKISPASIAKATVSGLKDVTYNGKAQTQVPTVKLGSTTLKSGTDYTIAYKNNVNVGTATITITGKGNYTGSATKTFKINKPSKIWYRLFGNTLFDTMQEIVKQGWSGKGGTVIIATSGGFADALSAAGIAGLEGAPVLLVNKNSLPSQTENELIRLKPKKIIIAGGDGAISNRVANQIKTTTGVAPRRIYGETATGTAAKLNEAYIGKWTSGIAILATNASFYDALSVAPISYAKHYPIFLTEGKRSVSKETINAMKKCGIKQVIVVGGTGAIPDKIVNTLKSNGIGLKVRLWGETAYDTSAAIANWGLINGMSANNMGVATGASYYDALCGASLCGKNNAVLVLTEKNKARNTVVPKNKNAQIGRAYVFGGDGAVSDKVYKAFEATTK